jgi:hypothetical protein
MNGKRNYETITYDNVDYISYENGKMVLVHDDGFKSTLLDNEVNRVEMIKMNALVGGSV